METALNVGLIIIVCLAIIFMWYMIYDSNRFVVAEYKMYSTKLKRDKKIIFLSDLHNKEYGKDNSRLLEEIDRQKPDMILVGGDMMNACPGASFEKAVAFLKKISASYPVFYAMGNHEYRSRIYPETYGDMHQRYMDALKDTGIIFLDNESVFLEEDNIRITGITIDRKYYKRFAKRKMETGYVESVIGSSPKDAYQILLAHNPEFFSDYAGYTKDLVLSGHVHGGVARLPFIGGVIAPSLMPFPHYDGGKFDEYDSHMILSRGLGMHTIPVRLFNPGELVLIYLRKES